MREWIRGGRLLTCWAFGAVLLSGGQKLAATELVLSEAPIGSAGVARCPDGTYVVYWDETDNLGHLVFSKFRRFAPGGSPLTATIPLAGTEGRGTGWIGCEADRLVAFWLTNGNAVAGVVPAVHFTTFGADGAPVMPIVELSGATDPAEAIFTNLSVAPWATGGWIAHWGVLAGAVYGSTSQRVVAGLGPDGPRIEWSDDSAVTTLASNGTSTVQLLTRRGEQGRVLYERRLNADGSAAGPATPIATFAPGESYAGLASSAGFEGDRYWHLVSASNGGIGDAGRLFAVTTVGGAVATPLHFVQEAEFPGPFPRGAGVDSRGRAIAGWEEPLQLLGHPVARMQSWLASGRPLSEVIPLTEPGEWLSAPPAVAVGPAGDWIVVWAKSTNGLPSLRARFGSFQDGCTPSSERLCLSGNRFQVSATYRDHLGRDGVGKSLPLTADSGSFWFFDSAILELFIKVVDACSHPDFENFWVYAAGLTDLEVELTVIDTWSGESWSRSTHLGEPFPPILDSAAFDTCSTTTPIAAPE